ncbi:AAA family ATPase [Saccharothrix stipae]
MLRSFRVGNHRSFRAEQELLLMPVYAKDREALPVAAVYGANASGKSNLLDGLKFMADAVRDSFAQWSPGGGVPRRPFKLDPEAKDQPSVFVAEFVEDGVRYTYGFEVDDERVLSEWLYSYPEKRKRVLFDRSGDQIKFGRAVAEGTTKAEVLEELLRPNSLFLSLAAQTNIVHLIPPRRWFVERLRFRENRAPVDLAVEIDDFIGEQPELHESLIDLLRAADFGIRDISVSRRVAAKVTVDDGTIFDGVVELPSVVSGTGSSAESGESVASVGPVRQMTVKYSAQAWADAERRIRLVHGRGEFFELDEESAGTRSWLGLLPDVLRILRHGGLLVIDEIDESLHSLLTARLIALFNDPQANVGSGQLIFTTHDATLLHPPLADEVLLRDEIWFVGKGRTGASTLYPLSDFKPRSEDNLERRYLAGQYGGVPTVYEELFADAVRSGGDGEA